MDHRGKVVATIEARMRSSRLPGKVLMSAAGRPLLQHMVERLARASTLDAIVIATTTDGSCDPIEELAARLGVGCYRGSEDDVLGRVLEAAQSAQADVIVETTGDCPLIDPSIVDRVIETFLAADVDYCTNVLGRTYPPGMDVQVFPRAVLEEVAALTDDPVDHEHVSIYIYDHPKRFRLLDVPSGLDPDVATLRLTLDTPEDYQLIRTIFEELYPSHPEFGFNDVLELLRRRPELRRINERIRPRAVR